MRALLTAIVILVLPITVQAGVPSQDNDDTRAWETVLDLNVIDRVLDMGLKHHEVERPQEWMPLGRFVAAFPGYYRSHVPTVDPWNSPYTVRSVGERLVVVSRGPDGLLDSFQSPDADAPLVLPRVDEDVVGDDIVLIVGDTVLNPPRTPVERVQITMATLRTIGTAVESYSIDHPDYPGQPEGLDPVEGVRSILEPLYIRRLPLKDAWGNDLLYWSDELHYIIVSVGTDGVLDQAYGTDDGTYGDANFVGEYADTATDMVFADGKFAQWPRIEDP